MASQVVLEDFRGSGALAGTAPSALTGVTPTNWTTFNQALSANTSYTRGAANTSVLVPSVGQGNFARLNFSGVSHSAGVTTFEASVRPEMQMRVWMDFEDRYASLEIGASGAGAWFIDNAGATSSGTFTAAVPGATVVLRMEFSSTQARFYVEGTLVGSYSTSIPYGVNVIGVRFGIPRSGGPHGLTVGSTVAALTYFHMKTETVTGALGGPAPPPPPVIDRGRMSVSQIYGYVDHGDGYLTLYAPWSAVIAVSGVAYQHSGAKLLSESFLVRRGEATASTALQVEGALGTQPFSPRARLSRETFFYIGEPDSLARQVVDPPVPELEQELHLRGAMAFERLYYTSLVVFPNVIYGLLPSAPQARLVGRYDVEAASDTSMTLDETSTIHNMVLSGWPTAAYVSEVVFTDFITAADIARDGIILTSAAPNPNLVDPTLSAAEQDLAAQELLETQAFIDAAKANPPAYWSLFWTAFNTTYEVP